MIYKCKHFNIKELVPPETYNSVGTYDKWKLWMLFDIRALRTLDALRTRYGTARVNTWAFGESYSYRGYRPEGCETGTRWSQHRRGAAFDIKFSDCTAEEVRGNILNMSHEGLEMMGCHMITRIEDNVNWLHFDTGNYVNNGINLV